MIRNFGSFQAAASEAALCRIFAGQYTMIDLGRQLGRHVGDCVLGHFGHGASRRSLRKKHSRSQARPARTAPAAAAQVKGLKPPGARGRLSGRQAARLPALTAGVNQPARVNTTLLLAVLAGGIVNVTRR